MGLCAAPRKTRALASDARAPLRLGLSLGSPCITDTHTHTCVSTESNTGRQCLPPERHVYYLEGIFCYQEGRVCYQEGNVYY